mgnify:CR=1 FL=1
MNTSEINERELRVIKEVGRDKNLTQRKISHSLGLSLGTTNLILKKLASKGYIKTRQLNRRKIQELVLTEYQKGKTHFIIFGDGKLADIIEVSLRNLNKKDLQYRRASTLEEICGQDATILWAQAKGDSKNNDGQWIDVLASISGG